METALTRQLKLLCRTYKPKIPTPLRTICWAEEVPMPNGGICDVVRFEDEYDSATVQCRLKTPCPFPDRHAHHCRGCTEAHREYGKVHPLCTCYEVKISLSDFHSGHGANFFGHENYFVVPKELVKSILPELDATPVGVLALSGKSLRCVRPCTRLPLSDSLLLQLMYAAFKKQMHR